MAASRREIEYLKYNFYKETYRGDRLDGGSSQTSTSAPNSRPTSARKRETSRPATPAWSSAPSHPDDPPWPRPPIFARASSRPATARPASAGGRGRPASASSRGERPQQLKSEASADVAAITAVAPSAGEANTVAAPPPDAAQRVAVEAPPAEAKRVRPSSAPVGGRRTSVPKCAATPQARWEEQHLHYHCANRPPAHGSIYATRGPYPGPGTYYSPEKAAKALARGHTFNHSARTTEEYFVKEDGGPSRPAGDPRLLYRPVPKFRGGLTRDKPVGGFSFDRSPRM